MVLDQVFSVSGDLAGVFYLGRIYSLAQRPPRRDRLARCAAAIAGPGLFCDGFWGGFTMTISRGELSYCIAIWLVPIADAIWVARILYKASAG